VHNEAVTFVPIPESWRGRALVVESIDDPVEAWFSDAEIAEAGAFARERRREEWLLSRYAAKRLAVLRGATADPRGLAIVRPRMANGSWVSISHSHGVAAAAVDDAPVGIDVERVRPIDERVARHFVSEEEITEMRRCKIPNRVLHWWCAKEAAWKQLGGAARFLKEVPLRLEKEGEAGLLFRNVETYAAGEYVMALTLRGCQEIESQGLCHPERGAVGRVGVKDRNTP
jgi:phosphopantetheine--protein transferase-like protein